MATQRQSMEVEEPPVTEEQRTEQSNWQLFAVGGGVAVIALIGAAILLTGGGKADGGAGGGGEGAGGGLCARGQVSQPKQYGTIMEKTIWSYHYDEECKSKEDCKLSDFLQLCKDTIEQKKGSFNFNLVHKDEVFDYVTKMELPDDWENLDPQYQKDTVMNALLARYGGVALDLKTIMFHSLDEWWDDKMVDENLVFKGFKYTPRNEIATWFMMARREGLLRAATTAQSLESGNDPSTCVKKEQDKKLCYGSGMVSLALCRHFPEYCKCYMDEKCDLKQWKNDRFEVVYEKDTYDVEDPHKSVQSPHMDGQFPPKEAWQLFNSIQDDKETWATFESRYQKGKEVLPFITLQLPGDALQKSKHELLADTGSFFYQWLCLADHPATDGNECGRGAAALAQSASEALPQHLGGLKLNTTPAWWNELLNARSLRREGRSLAEADFLAPVVFASECPAGAGRGAVKSPEFYGKMPERTIWAYHYDEDCKTAADCKLSDFLTLCKETIEMKKASFDFRLVHKDEVFKYVTPMELPDQWESLDPWYQKDTVINALLARYGGVGIDLKTVMFHSLDKWWDEQMLDENLVFKGFWYKTRSEVATWFMMARREGLMRAAATAQSFESGNEPSSCADVEKEKKLCYGSNMVLLALCRHYPKYCTCYNDRSKGCGLKQWKELDGIFKEDSYKLKDPRESVQSPLEKGKIGVDDWKLLDDIEEKGEAWEKFEARHTKGADTMPFITLQSPGDAAKMSRADLLSNTNTFFYQWLCLAGHDATDGDACGSR